MRLHETKPVKTTCPYCGVGCGVMAKPDGLGNAVILGDVTHPANYGRLCVKGAALGETIDLEGRLLHPEIGGARVGWDAALAELAAGFRRIAAEHGPEAIAFYLSGQLLTEDYYVANKLAKGFIGTPHVDTNSRLCMASSVAGHKRAFGADVVPQCYEDLDVADLIVLAGSNAAWCHPILYQRIQKARERSARVVNIDPRATATTEGSDLQLSIAPGSDIALWNGLLVWLADHGALDAEFIEAHTNGFETALAEARAQSGDVSAATGLDAAEIERFYRWWAETPRVVSCYSQGVNQSAQGTDKVNAILNCHLATGRIGKTGCGPLSLTGQPNAMGGREVGGMANMLAAHMDFSEAERSRVRRFWNAPNLVAGPGLKAVQMFEAIQRGQIKALWVMGTNPAVSLPDADGARAALTKLELFVISENVASTDTAALAHIRLPAAAWGEKDGTVTNSERRISRQRAFLPLPGEARPDWRILAEAAAHLGWGGDFAYAGPADIFREHAALSGFENDGQRAFDISARECMTKAECEQMRPFQWPHPRGGAPTRRLFADGRFFTPDGKAQFVAAGGAGLAAAVSADWPLVLNTGRIRDQWHTMTRTGKSARLSQHIAEPFVEIHPEDAARFGLAGGGLAEVKTAYGAVALRVVLAEGQRPGSLFAPMHWSAENSGAARVCALVQPLTDPVSGQPESKATPAHIRPLAASHWGYCLSREMLRPDGCAYWSASRVAGGFLTGFALEAPEEGLAAWARGLAGQGDLAEFEDAGLGIFRAARLDDGRLIAAIHVAPEPAEPPGEWLTSLLSKQRLTPEDRRAILAGRPASGAVNREGGIVCVCFQVRAARIAAAIAQGADSAEAVGLVLRAGTNCGSCVPEIKRMLKDTPQTFRAAAE
ncbi:MULTISPECIES: nitrate reductase [Rhodomicrobium]|uniref:nitrate reductase n=1 Tax=Rhodomicrobium TaxID=1068 RepID=UPI000B4AE125|nr:MULTISPECIES: nitrate reductase [Rhodomicrobium]